MAHHCCPILSLNSDTISIFHHGFFSYLQVLILIESLNLEGVRNLMDTGKYVVSCMTSIIYPYTTDEPRQTTSQVLIHEKNEIERYIFNFLF